jgi:glutamyl/glutaminyl-tRNA synthetase
LEQRVEERTAALNAVNKQYIRTASVGSLISAVRPRLEAHGVAAPDNGTLGGAIGLMKERVTTLEEFVTECGYLYADPQAYDEEAKKRKPGAGYLTVRVAPQ